MYIRKYLKTICEYKYILLIKALYESPRTSTIG